MSTRCCSFCRTPLVPKVFQCGTCESPAQFDKRQYCDRRCRDLGHKTKQPNSHPWIQAGLRVKEKRMREQEQEGAP